MLVRILVIIVVTIYHCQIVIILQYHLFSPEFRIGTFYSPMLPLIQVIKLFILFYVKRVCVITAYCQTNSMYVVTVSRIIFSHSLI